MVYILLSVLEFSFSKSIKKGIKSNLQCKFLNKVYLLIGAYKLLAGLTSRLLQASISVKENDNVTKCKY